MKATYKDNEQKGGGWGFIQFSETLIPDGPWQVSVQRASDQQFLTGRKPNQWVGENFFMPLKGQALPDGSLELALGPAVVDSLDQQDQYRVQLKGSDGNPVKAPLRIGRITYSPAGSAGHTGAVIEDDPEPVEEESPSAEEQAEPEPILEEPLPEPGVPQAAPDSGKSGKKIPWLFIILAALLLACIAAGAYWYMQNAGEKEEASAEPVSETPAREEEKPAAPAGTNEPAVAASVPQPVEPPLDLSISERVNQFFLAPNSTPQAALEFAKGLSAATPQDQDAIYRLWYYGATNNQPAAFMEYAQCLDPTRPQWGTIEKDGAVAYEYYKNAEANGIAQAAKALAHLKSWLNEQAASGNAQARAWLNQLPR